MSIGVNLRVTGFCRQGGRRYMEDYFSVAYQQTEDEKDLEYAFIGIYDGHGGAEAAAFAREHLMSSIIKHKHFWSDDDEEVLRAIKDGYIATHYAMWKEQEKWPRTASGLPSTAGTTASVAFIRRGKIYVGHVGDSGIVLGYQPPNSTFWKAKPLTRDHKPENIDEMNRIHQCGGKVVLKSGVPRVVWSRPKIGHQGPVRRSTPIDEIPFLAVARSLGDLWSYNSNLNQFIVSPNPDCSVITIDTSIHRCLIFGTDGLYNMLSPQMAVSIVYQTEKHNEYTALNEDNKAWLNPSKLLVEKALDRWSMANMRADNTSVVTLMLDPPGPPRAQVLKEKKKDYPATGLKIMTRFKDEHRNEDGVGGAVDGVSEKSEEKEIPQTEIEQNARKHPINSYEVSSNFHHALKEKNFEISKIDEENTSNSRTTGDEKENNNNKNDDSIQINEISSSSPDDENSNENHENATGNKHNLRSSSKIQEIPLRKSVRLTKTKCNDEKILRSLKNCLKKRILRKRILKKKSKLILEVVKKNTLVKLNTKNSLQKHKKEVPENEHRKRRTTSDRTENKSIFIEKKRRSKSLGGQASFCDSPKKNKSPNVGKKISMPVRKSKRTKN